MKRNVHRHCPSSSSVNCTTQSKQNKCFLLLALVALSDDTLRTHEVKANFVYR